MANNYGPAFILGAGAITFGNEWLQKGELNTRVPIATLVGAGVIGLVGMFSPGAGNSLGVMVLLAAMVVESNGKSAIQELAGNLPQAKS
jgi:hypothetical protein